MTIDSLSSLFPKNASEYTDRILLNLGNSVEYPSDKIKIDENNSRALLFSRNARDIFYFLKQLAQLGFTSKVGALPGELSIEANGWDRIAKLSTLQSELNQAFIAMWFNNKTKSFFEKGIKPAVEFDGQTTCLRIDKTEHNNKICDQIIAETRKSKYLIADFTENRGGVYYETGYAMGLGIPVIWSVHKDHLKNVHFDTRQYNHICYENEGELFKKLKNRIEATIPKSVNI